MTLHELKVALDKIVAHPDSEVIVSADGVSVDEDDLLELRIEWVEKLASRIIIHASD